MRGESKPHESYAPEGSPQDWKKRFEARLAILTRQFICICCDTTHLYDICSKVMKECHLLADHENAGRDTDCFDASGLCNVDNSDQKGEGLYRCSTSQFSWIS